MDGLGFSKHFLYEEAFLNYCRNFSTHITRLSRQCREAIACTSSGGSHKSIYEKKVCQTEIVLSHIVPQNRTNFSSHILFSRTVREGTRHFFTTDNNCVFCGHLSDISFRSQNSEVIDNFQRFVFEQLRYYAQSSIF